MLGFAQALLKERIGRTLNSQNSSITHAPTWPLLEKLLSTSRLHYIDYAIAERLLRPFPDLGEEVAAFICHLSLASRNGHLCIQIEKHNIFPLPQQLWLDTSNQATVTSEIIEDLEALTKMISMGAASINRELLTAIVFDNLKTTPITPFCHFGSLYYLQKNWVYESTFLEHLLRIENSQPEISLDISKVNEQVDSLLSQKKLLPEQAQAILDSCKHSLSIISGGPGTGKTYTAGQLVKIYWEGLSEKQQKICEIVLAAPTGKAAANLQASFAKATSSLTDFKPVTAKTLHSLLNIKSSKTYDQTESPTRLSADLIIVDESSMIDLRIMSMLFASVKKGARLILLGDKHQLPPVESGCLFSDLMNYRQTSQLVFAGELKVCMRSELKPIQDIAKAINSGSFEEVMMCLNRGSEVKGVSRLLISDPEQNIAHQQIKLLEYAVKGFPINLKPENDPLELLEAFNSFRILSPLRQGPFGIEELNAQLLKYYTKKLKRGEWLIAPIMIAKTNYPLNLFNGEVGVIVRRFNGEDVHSTYFQEGDFALFCGKDETKKINRIPALMLPQFDYAYCLSVHKSQGSEFGKVLALVPPGSELFGREVLYTAATRARRHLEIWGGDEILRATISQTSHRLSGVLSRLNSINTL